ncbi:MAG: DUF4398 domain-containing protein [Dokdonella sp.]
MTIAILTGVMLAACAPTRPPPDLLSNAMRSLEDAQLAEARTYAPLELRFATERYEQAQSAMNATDYGTAARLSRESVANSELAIVKSRLGKSREAVDALKIQNEELRRDLDSVVEENQ